MFDAVPLLPMLPDDLAVMLGPRHEEAISELRSSIQLLLDRGLEPKLIEHAQERYWRIALSDEVHALLMNAWTRPGSFERAMRTRLAQLTEELVSRKIVPLATSRALWLGVCATALRGRAIHQGSARTAPPENRGEETSPWELREAEDSQHESSRDFRGLDESDVLAIGAIQDLTTGPSPRFEDLVRRLDEVMWPAAWLLEHNSDFRFIPGLPAQLRARDIHRREPDDDESGDVDESDDGDDSVPQFAEPKRVAPVPDAFVPSSGFMRLVETEAPIFLRRYVEPFMTRGEHSLSDCARGIGRIGHRCIVNVLLRGDGRQIGDVAVMKEFRQAVASSLPFPRRLANRYAKETFAALLSDSTLQQTIYADVGAWRRLATHFGGPRD